MYKGYILTKNKRPLQKYKDKDLLTYEQVKDAYEFAGILDENTVLIDIDDEQQSELLMQIVENLQLDTVVRKTTRGRHFLFRNSNLTNCGTNKKLACGLTADIKIGSKNGIQILKVEGKERFVEWDTEDRELAELPKWLYPVNTKTDFFNMKEGDGRDSALYGYILTLNSMGFSKDECRDCITIINKWILGDSLTEEDIDRITRDEAFPEEIFYNGKSFLHNNFAAFLKNNNHIKRINGQLHIYKNGVYVSGRREIEAQMIKYIPTIKDAQRVETLKYIDILCSEIANEDNTNLIAFDNGLYNITTGELTDFSPDITITNKIPWNYNPEAYSELADSTLNKLACFDESVRALLEECIGYCFYRRNELSKSFFLTGSGANGKSTFLDMVKNVLGDGNYSALDLAELDERFSVATMAGMLANIGDDISDEFLVGKSTATFKKLVSGNIIKAEIKNDPNIFFMKPTVKLLFSANALPRTKAKGFIAIKRRLVIIPFNAKFSKNDPDYNPYITWDLKKQEVNEYLIMLGIEGLKRIILNNSFTESIKVEKELEEYETENNPIIQFIEECSVIENQPCKDVYREYKRFCIENGYAEMTANAFGRELKSRINLETKVIKIDGKTLKIYKHIQKV